METCPNFLAIDLLSEATTSTVVTPSPESEARKKTEIGRKFHLGNELGAQNALQIMRARYAHLIGILGSTAAGKTCFLSSLYLMASSGTLPDPYRFAGSLTLQAFEDRARGVRQWPNGKLPDQLADHTILSDPRQPSLLHLALRESEKDERFDLLLTDLPGEWTDNLALRSTGAESFRFLRRADGIILVVDGNVLVSDQRHVELQRMRYFTERLAEDVKVNFDTPFVILVSKSDETGMQMPAAAEELTKHVQQLGFPAKTVLSASFSRKPTEIKNGVGVFTAIESVLSYRPAGGVIDASAGDHGVEARTFSRFRG